MRVYIENIKIVAENILKKIGVPVEQAKIIVDTIEYAHLTNKGTHGIGRLPIYVRKIKEGLMSAETIMDLINETSVISHYNANNGFGQVAAYIGMNTAIKKAKENGIAAVGIRCSNNFGTAGYFVEMVAKENMIGFVFSNSSPAIAPTGGNKPIFGTNPIAIGFPGGNHKPPVILDMATSNAARGKIRLAATNGQKIPADWALDANGNSTTDPNEALKGTMNPIGGYKGYGLSLIVDVIAGLLTGAAFGGDVKPLNHKGGISNYGHLMIVLDIEKFQRTSSFLGKMDYLTQKVKACGEGGQIFMPGEKGQIFKTNIDRVVNIPDKQVEVINTLALELGVSDVLLKNFDL